MTSALEEEVRRFKRAAEDRQAKVICRGRQRVEGERGREEGKEGGGEGTWGSWLHWRSQLP